MRIFSFLADAVGTVVTPAFLLFASLGILSSAGVKRVFDLRPLLGCGKRSGNGASPLSALSLALAGTLGVGNITGVASALMAGGPGAVVWMWIGAVAAIPLKYAEVLLAVRYRERVGDGWRGGAMYTIRNGFGGGTAARKAGAVFAVLCAANALVTGNLIQSNAAVSLLPGDRRILWGIALSLSVALSVCFGTKRIERAAARLMPPLTAFFLLVSLAAVLPHTDLIPGILKDTVRSAFSLRAVGAGTMGFTVREAVRFGVMRGIFSNEAGCGTSPTAHASADTDSAEQQAALGVAEVIFDTLILCTVTALVLLTADRVAGGFPWGLGTDPAPAALEGFRVLSGRFAAEGIRLSTVLFAYASVVAQIYYGIGAVRYLTESKKAEGAFLALSVLMPVCGAAVSPGPMWTVADLLLGSMTILNCSVLLLLRGKLRPAPVRNPPNSDSKASSGPRPLWKYGTRP